MKQTEAILLLSGGIDSTTLLAHLSAEGYKLTCITFDYGQILQKEITLAEHNAKKYRQEWIRLTVDFSFLADVCAILKQSPRSIPTNRTQEEIDEETPASYVPFRNGIFLAYAIAYGEAKGIREIFCGGNGLHSGQYPDDTLEFAALFEDAADVGTSPQYHPVINYPFANIPKSHIVSRGQQLGVKFTNTWSCYQNGTYHCGECDSCYQRLKAFNEADL